MAAETPDMDNTTSRFELDGSTYEVPDFLALDLDDWQIVWDEAGIALTDFSALDDPEQDAARLRRLANPRLERAFIMVALKRANPDTDLDQIRADAGRIKLVPYLTGLAGEEADPTLTSEPEPSSNRNSASSNESSSAASPESSDEPDGELATTSTGG